MIVPFNKQRTKGTSDEAAGQDSDGESSDDTDDEADVVNSAQNVANSTSTDDDQELDPDREAADERDIQEIIAEVEGEDLVTSDETRVGRSAVTKVRSRVMLLLIVLILCTAH